jgi:hypothetical protein
MRRIGKFRIERDIFRYNHERIKKILKDMVIIKCECLYHINAFEYIAFCDEFEEIKIGDEPLDYEITINDNKERVITRK